MQTGSQLLEGPGGRVPEPVPHSLPRVSLLRAQALPTPTGALACGSQLGPPAPHWLVMLEQSVPILGCTPLSGRALAGTYGDAR